MSHLSSTPTSSRLRGPRCTAALAAAALTAGLALTAPSATAVTAERPATPASVPTDTAQMQQALDQIVAAGVPGALLYTYDKGTVTELQSGLADLTTPVSLPGRGPARSSRPLPGPSRGRGGRGGGRAGQSSDCTPARSWRAITIRWTWLVPS